MRRGLVFAYEGYLNAIARGQLRDNPSGPGAETLCRLFWALVAADMGITAPLQDCIDLATHRLSN